MKLIPFFLTSLSLASASLAADDQALLERAALTGDWSGLRSEDSGVSIELGYTQEYLGVVSGGIQRTGEYNALGSLDLELDLEKLAHWKGATFHATGLAIIGSSISGEAIGDDSNVSNINYRNSVRLFELYLEQNFLDGRLSIRAGQLAADSEFFGSEIGEDVPGGGLFINSDFGAMPIASFNAPVPIYAIAAPGVRLRIEPTDATFVQVAVFDGNPAPDFLGDPSPDFAGGDEYNDHGVHVNLNSSEGVFVIGEAGFTLNQGEAKAEENQALPEPLGETATAGDSSPAGRQTATISRSAASGGKGSVATETVRAHGLPGSYKIGGYYHSDDFTRWSDGNAVRGIWAAYLIGAQKIWHENAEDSQGGYLFARASVAPEGRATLDGAIDGGMNYVGLLPGRDEDVLGVGYTYKHYSQDLSDALEDAGEEGLDAESILEVTYQINVAPWLTIQPDFQYVFKPGGRSSSSDAAVLGIRVSTLF